MRVGGGDGGGKGESVGWGVRVGVRLGGRGSGEVGRLKGMEGQLRTVAIDKKKKESAVSSQLLNHSVLTLHFRLLPASSRLPLCFDWFTTIEAVLRYFRNNFTPDIICA